MKKNKYHHGNLKEVLLNIAFEFIKKNDIDKLTLKILSDITGTSRSAIYSHFSSKEALIEAMILNGFIQFDEYVSPRLLDQKGIPLLDRLEHGSRAYIEFARENKVLYRLLFGSKYAHIRLEVMSKNDKNRSGFGALVSTIDAGQKSGIIKTGSPHKQAVIVWASLHGMASLLIDGFIGIENIYDELFQDMHKSIVSGLLLET